MLLMKMLETLEIVAYSDQSSSKIGREQRGEIVTFRCHGSEVSRTQQTGVQQIWQKKIDMYDRLSCAWCTQAQNGSAYFPSL